MRIHPKLKPTGRLRVGINGAGRIGRALLRHYLTLSAPAFDLVVVHDLMPLDQFLYLLEFDSVHGRLANNVPQLAVDGFTTCHGFVNYIQSKNTQDIPNWRVYDLDLLVEVSGAFSQMSAVQRHIQAGAAQVLLGSPLLNDQGALYKAPPEAVASLEPGQALDFTQGTEIFMAFSCTTQALQTLLKPLVVAGLGIESLIVTELHGFTSSQCLVDQAHQDWRRGRSATESIIPTTTQGIYGLEVFFPELKGKVVGFSIRVPVPNVAAVDICFHLTQKPNLADVLDVFRAAAIGPFKGILALDHNPGVSIDYLSRTESAIIALDLCQVNQQQLRLYAWYDNEYGYSQRIIDTLQKSVSGEIAAR